MIRGITGLSFVVVFAAVAAASGGAGPTDDSDAGDVAPEPFPLTFDSASIALNAIGSPEVTVRVTNVSEDVLDEYVVRLAFYHEDRPVREYDVGDSAFNGRSSDDLAPGASALSTWSAYGYESANAVVFTMRSATTVDGKVYTCSPEHHDCRRVACLSSESSCEDPE